MTLASLADRLHLHGCAYDPNIPIEPSWDHGPLPSRACPNHFGHRAPSCVPDLRNHSPCSRPNCRVERTSPEV